MALRQITQVNAIATIYFEDSQIPPHTESGAWGFADTASAACGVLYLFFGLWLIPSRRNFDGVVVLLATGVSLAPLLMILIDPLFQKLSAHFFGHPIYLLQIVVTEARITLWWAAFVAAAYLVKDFFAPRTRVNA
jgi:hypothetical protein